MFPLKRPSGRRDVKELLKIVNKYPMAAPHLVAWRSAYVAYLKGRGDPHAIPAANFPKAIAEQQRRLYETRKTGGPIRRLRNLKGVLCCPMCGSGTTGHVDHMLPQASYSEFSIFAPNLVPTCMHCNSSAKGGTVMGAAPARFIHPYFDKLASTALWQVEFIAPFEAVGFKPKLQSHLTGDDAIRVAFHLENVLAEQFQLIMGNMWSTLPSEVRRQHPSGATAFDLEVLALDKLEYAEIAGGPNCWGACFWRGVVTDVTVRQWLSLQAESLPASPLMRARRA